MSVAPFAHYGMMEKWLPASIARALADRAGPASDYTSPPQQSHELDDRNAYANHKPTREWWEGRQDHDLDTFGRPLRPGS